MANSIIGGGMLELPFVMSEFGVVITLILLFFVYFVTIISLTFLLKLSNLTGIKDYKKLARHAFDWKAELFADFCIFTSNFGVCISYLIIY